MKTNKHYVSEIDKRLEEFNQLQEKTRSQDAEIRKYQTIYKQRDYSENTQFEEGEDSLVD